tara:strand:- start:4748 stop:4870 length:123 start_codon:yes stop_codon:yes gene_type:complete
MSDQIKYLEYRIKSMEKEIEKLKQIIKEQNNYILGETQNN